jgi:hypothetical protein
MAVDSAVCDEAVAERRADDGDGGGGVIEKYK